ncbi:MAG: translation elongation factor Ts [Chloroflexi bacterium]|nr:translation elongation factor Ts [Chloroflexota bacterium]
MAISTEAIRALREETGAGIMDCKRALEEAGGDSAKAKELLRQKGLALAAKKAERAANQGLVEAYVHGGGRIGVLVEVNCETDFVARTLEFKELAHDLALQIAAMAPQVVDDETALDDLDISRGEPRLLYQPFIRDPSKTVRQVMTDVVARVGENIRVRRFTRFELGS